MMSFFKNLTFTRGVVVFGGLAVLLLGFLDFRMRSRLGEVVDFELPNAERVSREIQELGLEVARLQTAVRAEGYKGVENAVSYITGIATTRDIELGDQTVSHSSKPVGNFVDETYRIKPKGLGLRRTGFSRTQIANFLYKLEAENRRVRVTSLKLTPYPAIKPGELGTDTWIFEAEITSRQKKSS